MACKLLLESNAFAQELPLCCLNFNLDPLQSLCLASWAYHQLPKNTDIFKTMAPNATLNSTEQSQNYSRDIVTQADRFLKAFHHDDTLMDPDEVEKSLSQALKLHQKGQLWTKGTKPQQPWDSDSWFKVLTANTKEFDDIFSVINKDTKTFFSAYFLLNKIGRVERIPFYNYFIYHLLPNIDEAKQMAILTGATAKPELEKLDMPYGLSKDVIKKMRKSEIASHFGYKYLTHGSDQMLKILNSDTLGLMPYGGETTLIYLNLTTSEEVTESDAYGPYVLSMSLDLLDDEHFHASIDWVEYGGVSPANSVTSKNTNLEFYCFLQNLQNEPNKNEFLFYHSIKPSKYSKKLYVISTENFSKAEEAKLLQILSSKMQLK